MSKPAVVVLMFGGDREPPTYTFGFNECPVDLQHPSSDGNTRNDLTEALGPALVAQLIENEKEKWGGDAGGAADDLLLDIETYELVEVLVTDGEYIWALGANDVAAVLEVALCAAFPYPTGGAHDQDSS